MVKCLLGVCLLIAEKDEQNAVGVIRTNRTVLNEQI